MKLIQVCIILSDTCSKVRILVNSKVIIHSYIMVQSLVANS